MKYLILAICQICGRNRQIRQACGDDNKVSKFSVARILKGLLVKYIRKIKLNGPYYYAFH